MIGPADCRYPIASKESCCGLQRLIPHSTCHRAHPSLWSVESSSGYPRGQTMETGASDWQQHDMPNLVYACRSRETCLLAVQAGFVSWPCAERMYYVRVSRHRDGVRSVQRVLFPVITSQLWCLAALPTPPAHFTEVRNFVGACARDWLHQSQPAMTASSLWSLRLTALIVHSE